MIKQVYLGQTVTTLAKVVGGVIGQGRSLYPALFNIYTEVIVREALSDLVEGMKV